MSTVRFLDRLDALDGRFGIRPWPSDGPVKSYYLALLWGRLVLAPVIVAVSSGVWLLTQGRWWQLALGGLACLLGSAWALWTGGKLLRFWRGARPD